MTKNSSLSSIHPRVRFEGGYVDRRSELVFCPHHNVIEDIAGRIAPVDVPPTDSSFVFGLSVEIAVDRYNKAC